MIRGVEQQSVPYVLEDDRSNPIDQQTVFWVKPKTGHDNNLTVRRYMSAMKENARKGTRDINVSKMDLADQEEFAAVVEKVENYGFPKTSEFFKKYEEGVLDASSEPEVIQEIARTLSADHLAEILEVSNNINKLKEGAKKNSNS